MEEDTGGQAEVFTPIHHIDPDPQHFEETDSTPRPPKIVAVVDNEAFMSTLIGTIVEGAGHHVVVAHCLADGLKLIRSGVAALAICDLDLGEIGRAGAAETEYSMDLKGKEGLILLQAAREAGVSRVLCSGTLHEVESHPETQGIPMLKKPGFIAPLQALLAQL